jgi:transposase
MRTPDTLHYELSWYLGTESDFLCCGSLCISPNVPHFREIAVAQVTITERQLDLLRDMTTSRRCPTGLALRAAIILLAFERRPCEAIAQHLGCERHTVGTWRRRWKAHFEQLVHAECCGKPGELRRTLETVLSDAPRPGRPPRITAEQVAMILSVACEPPQQSGVPRSHWTRETLTAEIKKRGIVTEISARQVGRFLKDGGTSTASQSLLVERERQGHAAVQQHVREVCETYQKAPERLKSEGIHTVCVDEKTGMQALERAAETKPMRPGQVEKREHEYIRHGTQCLTANFEVATGQILSPTVEATRTEEQFAAHIERTIATDAKAGWLFVADNLTTHTSATLVILIATLLGISRSSLGVKGKSGVLKSVSSRRAF